MLLENNLDQDLEGQSESAMPCEEGSPIGYENRPGLTEFRVQRQDLKLCPYPYERKTRCISRTLSQQTVSHCHFFPSLLTPLSARLETLGEELAGGHLIVVSGQN